MIKLLTAIALAWAAALLLPLELGWVALGFSLLALAGVLVYRFARRLLAPRLRPERWLLVGSEETAELLRRSSVLRDHAVIAGAVPAHHEGPASEHRREALEAVGRYGANRVVIADGDTGDGDLLELVRAFKSVGVPIGLLPRPLQLLEAPGALPSTVGGIPMIKVEALAARSAIPYSGPDRRRDRTARITVVVPAMNEGANIGQVLSQLPEDLHEVLLIDGDSSDDTVAVARRAYPGIEVLAQSGRGKGDALRLGFAAATGNMIVMLDADGSADPAEIPRFAAALEAGADFAKGSRFVAGGGSADITPLRRLGNSALSASANRLHGTHFTDLCYGYNAFWTRCLPFISLDTPGFEVETLINLRVADAGLRISEVPSFEAERISGQSNLNTFRDGFRVLRTIVAETHRRRTIHPDRHPLIEAADPSAGTAAG